MRDNSRTLKVSPAGRSFMQFMRAFNTGDPDEIRGFISQQFDADVIDEYGVDTLTDYCYTVYCETGGMRVHKVFVSEDYYVMIVMEAINNGKLFLDKIKVDDVAPYPVIEYVHEEFIPANGAS